jgi:hypothetical protein
MNPADQVLVQKHLGATLAKVAAIQKNLLTAKETLEKQQRALYELTKSAEQTTDVAPVGFQPPRSASILDADVDMSQINAAIKKLAGGCDCPNLQQSNFTRKEEA